MFSDPFGLCPDDIALGAHGVGHTVVVDCADGSQDIRSGGSRAWRNSNPGNIKAGRYANDQYAIGGAGGFAVFDNAKAGQDALSALLHTNNYQQIAVAQAIARFAPSSENDTKAYQRAVTRATGINPYQLMSSLSEGDLKLMMHAIRRHEGWQVGTVENRRPPQ